MVFLGPSTAKAHEVWWCNFCKGTSTIIFFTLIIHCSKWNVLNVLFRHWKYNTSFLDNSQQLHYSFSFSAYTGQRLKWPYTADVARHKKNPNLLESFTISQSSNQLFLFSQMSNTNLLIPGYRMMWWELRARWFIIITEH